MADTPTTKPKILYFITKSNWGGAQRHVFDLASNLSPKQYETLVVLGGTGPLKTRLEECDVKTRSLELARDIKTSNDSKAFVSFFTILREEKPDVLHVHSPKAAGIGAFVAQVYNLLHRKKIKVIYTVHGWTFKEDRAPIQKIFIMIFSWLTILFSDKVIVLGEREYDDVKNWPLTKQKLVIIKNGIAKPSYLARTKARDYMGEKIAKKLSRNTIVVGTIGELHHNKGQAHMIEAMSGLKNTTDTVLVVIGEGEERTRLEKLIKDKGLEERVFLIGQLHNAALYLKAFDIFVFASVKEGMPYAILEAARAELPIIASSVGNIPDLIDDMQSGILIKPKNTREIEESIRFLIAHPEKRSLFAENAIKKINSDYSLSKMLEETLKLY